METMIEILSTYGYILLALYSFTGGMFGIIAAGILASTGRMDISLVIIIASTSNFLGDLFFFTFVRFIKKYFKMDYNRLVKKYSRKVAYTKQLIRKKGWLGMFIQKYIKFVRVLYPIVLGTMGYDRKKFIVLNFFASIVFVASISLTSYFFSAVVLEFFKN